MNTNTTITTVLGMIWYVNVISIFLPWQSHIYTIYSYLYIPMRLYWLQGDYGDVSPRKKIRTDNKCKSFKWYLTEVYPELFIPGEAIASGEVIFKFMLLIRLLPLPSYAEMYIFTTNKMKFTDQERVFKPVCGFSCYAWQLAQESWAVAMS